MKTKINSRNFTTGVFIAAAFCSMMMSSVASAQLVGTKNIPGDYATLAAAITDLNTVGVGAGGCTLNLIAGNPEIAPAGGYVVGGAGSVVLTTASAANPIVIQGNSNTITANAGLVAGALNDAIFKLIGADFVTITGFTMLENAANTTTAAATNNMTEWGVALLYVTTTDGAQNDTISNNTITLNRTYQNTWGIYSNSTHSATAIATAATATTTAGGNSGLKVYGNNISNVNQGIVVVGPTAAADYNTGLDIGGTGGAQANSITNWGTTGTFSGYISISATLNCILVRNSTGFNVSFNTLTSSVGGNTATTSQRAIYVPSFSVAPTGTFTNTINSNIISVQSGFVTGTLNGIIVETTTGTATSSISISSNDFNTFGHTVASPTGAVNFINDTMTHLNTTINSNTFTGISLTTTGSVLFIGHSVTNPAGGIDNISSNMIVTSFTKTGTGGGTLTFINNSAGSSTTVTQTWNSNNFSNITVPGTTVIAGIVCTDGGTVNHKCNNNTVSNIAGGTGSITGILSNFGGGLGGNGNEVVGNTISNISSAGAITGITLGASATATTVSSNTIFALSTSGASAVTGISSGNAGSASCFKNKIYDLGGTNAGTTVNGILVTGGTSHTIFNNLIGNLTASAASGTDVIRGISSTSTATSSTINVYFNTVFINATSSGVNFGTTGIFHTASTTATTATLNLRNNIIDNRSTPNGTGLTVVYRRSAGTAGTLANYASTSNNNDFFLGTAGANKFIYSDGTSTASTIAAYKAGAFTAGTIAPRDSVSFSDPTYQSTTGSSAVFLHIDTTVPTQVESGGAPIAGISDDFDGNTRNASTPDVGADEFAGVALDLTPPNIVYTPLSNTGSTGSRTLTATITDPSGVPTAGAGLPVLYWRINAGSYTAATGTFIGSDQYQFTFGSGVFAGDVVSYYIVAQDSAGTPNVGSSPSAGASGFTANPPAAATPPTTPNSYTILSLISGSKNVGAGGDYTTLTAAIADLNAKELSASLTLILTDATYPSETFPIVINANTGSSATNTITIRPATGVSPTISGSSTSSIIRVNGASWVTIDGSNSGPRGEAIEATRDLTISNTSTATGTAAIHINSLGAGAGATNDTIKNTNLSCGADQSTSTSVTYGISQGGATLGVGGADNDNNSFINNSITKVNIGIYSSGESAANPVQNTVIANNTIGPAAFGSDQIGRAGIIFNLTNNATVTGNEVRFVGVLDAQSSTGGSYDKFGISHAFNGWSETTFGDLAVSNTLIANNKIHDIVEENTFSAVGIFMAGGNGSSDTLNKTVNNFIWNVRADGTTPDNSASIGIASGKGDIVAFNTVYMAGDLDPLASVSASVASFGVQITSTTVVNLALRDNIIFTDMTSNTATVKHGSISIPASFSWGTGGSNYNDLYVPAANTQAIVGRVGAANAVTLAAWQTASSQDANSISADPGFVSATNLHLAALTSPACNVGIPFGSVATDIDGESRSPTRPDMGADETLSNDLSGLVLSAGAIVPAFAPGTLSYTVSPDPVPHSTTSTTVTATLADSNAGLKVNGVTRTSGVPTPPISLVVGPNVITVLVTPEFGPTKTYTVTVNRAPLPAVTDDSDSGPGSLREALANSFDGDTITFTIPLLKPATPDGFTSTITLTSGELVIDKNVTISGPGADVLQITRSSGTFRIFHVVPGHTVTISGLTISNGLATGTSPADFGGGIYSDRSNLTVTNCEINGNTADFGGGIFSKGSNDFPRPGEAPQGVPLGSLTVIGSTLDNNTTASGGAGGGIYSYGVNGSAELTINNSTLSANAVPGGPGGAIFNDAGSFGSAIARIANSTFSRNNGDTAGGIFNNDGALTIGNTILKKGTTGANLFPSGGTITSAGYNLSDDPAGGDLTGTAPGGLLPATGDQRNTDPMLGLLQNNGGTMPTHAPLVNSPAIDQGKRDAIPALTTSIDQRGLIRPVNDTDVPNAADGSDIGAVELAAGSNPSGAASSKQHGPSGPVYEIPLPLGVPLGVECRSGGAAGVYQIKMTFPTAITFTSGPAGAQVINGTGSVSGVSRPEFNRGPNGSAIVVTIDLTGVTNAQTITVALLNVNGVADNDVGVRMGVLQGDTDGNRLTNSTDVSSVQFESGQPLTGPPTGNYKNDITASGDINSSDVSSVQFYSGTGLAFP